MEEKVMEIGIKEIAVAIFCIVVLGIYLWWFFFDKDNSNHYDSWE